MTTRLVLVALFVSCSTVAADDPIRIELIKAKAANKKELTRLHDKLLADINAVIKAEHDRGAGIDYLLKEKKGFEESGTIPVLPKLLPASREYQVGMRKADETLSAAYATAIAALDKAGQSADDLRNELKELQPDKQLKERVAVTAGKDEFLAGTVWVGTTSNKVDKTSAQPITLIVVSRDGRRFKGIERRVAANGKPEFDDVEGTVDGDEIHWEIPAIKAKSVHGYAGRTGDGVLAYHWAYKSGNAGEGMLKLVKP
ncbi:MAG TPA: hypothetical protein VHR66_29770 [Gemmataceae bacterium]|jgi:hypothetical protein|nr:hypothetical protein [Gemmataceae bacterium]